MYVLGFAVMDLIERLLRSIFFFLDSVIYSWIPTLYNTLVTISRTSPLSQSDIADMASRVYKLLAVFMVFKVTFSLIMYIVNPDDFSDKTKGVSKLITNIVISLALLILTPFIFRYAFEFQAKILKNNTLMTVIFGKDLNRENSTIDTVGEQIAFVAISPFIAPDTSMFPRCSTLYTNEYDSATGKMITKLNDECFGFEDVDDYLNDTCEGTNTLCKAVNNADGNYRITKDMLANYAGGIQHSNYHLLFRKEIVLATTKSNNKSEFVVKYWCGFSTAVAVIILLYFITACMDIGLRSIKLAFLQLIAPIPILSYIDPKSGKDGMFKKWYQTSLKTYLSLFIRLLSLYFAIYVIGRVNSLTDIIDGSYVTTMVIKVFIVIGALMFAKNFIKILEELGVKLDGGFQLNPIKKFNEQALGGKRITGAAGALTAGTADRFARLATARGVQKLTALNPFSLIGQTARGAASNAGFSGGMKAQAAVNRRLREGRINGLSATGSYLDYIGSKFGVDDATLESEASTIQRYEDKAQKIKEERDEKTLAYRNIIASEQEKQKTMKYAQSVRGNVKNKSAAMLDVATDVLNKKGNFGKMHNGIAEKIMNGNFAFTPEETALMRKEGFAVPTNATSAADLARINDHMINRGAQLNYKDNNNANKKTMSALSEALASNGGISFALSDDATIHTSKGDKTIKKGTVVTADTLAALENDIGTYEKDAVVAIANDLHAGETYVPQNIMDSEGRAFRLREKEFEEAKKEADDVQKAYNAEYGFTGDPTKELEDIRKQSSGESFGEYIKGLKDDMDNDKNAEKIAHELSKSNKTVEASNRTITSIENDPKFKIKYEGDDITLREYEEYIKPRKARLERNKKRKQERRSLFVNRG